MPVEITQADINILHTLEPRKSILNFSSAELAATQKWAEKFQDELSEKSPFYRLVHGDWRENDKTRVPIISFSNKEISFSEIKEDVKNYLIERGIFANSDTTWNIQVSRKGIEDTIRYAFKHNDNVSYNMLYNIKGIIENGILLDSVISEKNNPNKAHDTIFMHKMYCICNVDNNPHIAKISIEEFANVNGETIKRLYNLQDLKIEPLRIIGLTENQLRPSVLNGSDISISDLFQIVKSFDKDFYLNQQNFKRKDDVNMTEQEMLAQIEALRKEFEGKLAKMEEKFDDLSSKVETIDKFVAAITEAQGFEQTMNEVESVTKQLTGCNEAVFYCYDNAAEKFFSGSEDHRNWTDPQSAQDIKSAFDSGVISENGSRAIIPLISSKGETVGVIAAEKENGFTAADLDYFKQGSQIIGTVELALNKEFEHQGRVTDELTGLKNRQGLNEYVSDTVRRNINEDKPVNIVMCDIDHFKSINDTYGHDAGDIVLKNVAQILQDGTRAGSDCAFRMGGEEMVLILNCEPERAYEIAERLRAEVESTVHTVALDGKEQEINVTISMGIHQMKPDREMTAENARAVFDSEFKSADELVYAAKESGRNKVVADISETVVELGSYISDDIPTYDIDTSENDFEDFLESNEKTEQQSDSQAFGRESSDEYCIFTVNDGSKEQYFRDDSTADVNDLINRFITGGCYEWSNNGFLNGCTEISKDEFNALDKVTVLSPAFSAKFDFVNDVISVWDDEKIARVDFETAQKSIVEEQSTINLEFEPLNYSIFIMNAGENAYYIDNAATDIDSLLQRFTDSGGFDGKYTDFLKDCTLISEVEFAELDQSTKEPPIFGAEFNLIDGVVKVWDKDDSFQMDFDSIYKSYKGGEISEDCSKFLSETENIKDWIDEAQDKLEERSNNIDEQSKKEIR